MKKILFMSLALLLAKPNLAIADCFLATESNKLIKQSGDCKSRHTPCSTFKIAISLMGYNEGILIDETHPELPFKEGYVDYVASWKHPQTPTSWMKNSCVWYSQITTQKLGIKKFSDFLQKFNYGNHDTSGDVGKNNGLTESWLGSSLQISPQEQVTFLQKLLDNKLPVSVKAQEMTKNILFVEDLSDGWKLYGKTGSCDSTDSDAQTGWFVGWIQKENRIIIFADYLEDEKKLSYSGGKQAKEQARRKLMTLIRL